MHAEEIYVIDIVTRDYFASFFQMVESLHVEIVSALRDDIRTSALLNPERVILKEPQCKKLPRLWTHRRKSPKKIASMLARDPSEQNHLNL